MKVLDELFKPKNVREIINYLEKNTEIDLTIFPNLYEVWDQVKKYINPKTTKIKIDLGFLNCDLSFLKNLNIQELHINGNLSSDILEKLGNCYIHKLVVNEIAITKSDLERLGIHRKLYADNELNSFYLDCLLVTKSKPENIKQLDFYDFISFESFNFKEFPNLEKIQVATSDNTFEYFAYTEEVIITSYYYHYFYRFIEHLNEINYPISNITLTYYCLDEYDLESTLDLLSKYHINEAKISFHDANIFYKNGEITELITPEAFLPQVKNLCQKLNFSLKNITIKTAVTNIYDIKEASTKALEKGATKLIVDVSSANKYAEDVDYAFLDSIPLELNFNYDTLSSYTASKEDYLNLVEAIKWYRQLLTNYNLSPVEKLLLAYDITKTFKYSKENYPGDEFRAPHNVIKDGRIVCAGYSALLCEIINNLDPGVQAVLDSLSDISHAITIVRLDDSKYDIHGLYELDATNDSIKENSPINILGPDYNALDLYQYFLIPFNEYKNVFGNINLPELYQKTIKDVYNLSPYFLHKYEILFSSTVNPEKIMTYLIDAKRPSLDTLKEILKTVRVAEGYSTESLEKEVANTILRNEFESAFNIFYDIMETNYFKSETDSKKII